MAVASEESTFLYTFYLGGDARAVRTRLFLLGPLRLVIEALFVAPLA
jgi:hypothetical protein